MALVTDATLKGNLLIIESDLPASIEVDAGVLQKGHRGITAHMKRQLGIGPGGQHDKSKVMWAFILLNLVIEVPDVVGMDLAKALDAIHSVQLTKGTVTGTTEPVASQSPVADAIVARGSAVDLTMTA